MVKKTISRFKETAYCARYRLDGQLLVVGGDEGIVRVCNYKRITL